jgi:hypothetical protein
VESGAAEEILMREMAETMSIECVECPGIGSPECDDCLVAFVCDRDADDAVVFDVVEERALRLLAASGLLVEVVSTGRVQREVHHGSGATLSA